MILYKLKKNNNENIKEAYGKYYARPVTTQTVNLDGLAEHMSSHNTGFSPGAVKGLLTDMVKCIKELVLNGIAVKIDDLAIFSIGIRTKKGADSEKEFTVAKNIEGVKLRARATGQLTSDKLDLLASLKNAATVINDGEDKDEDGDGGDDNGGGNGGNGGTSDGNGGTQTPDQGGSSSKPEGSDSGTGGSGSDSGGSGSDDNQDY